MKTKEELNTIKEEVEALNEKCRELTEEELKEVTGGVKLVIPGTTQTEFFFSYKLNSGVN